MENRICKTCGCDKPIDDFEKTKSGWRYECRICKNKYYNDLYANNDSRRKMIKESSKRLRVTNMNNLWAYLELHPCIDCGESDPVVLEFDHVRGDKSDHISSLVGKKNWLEVESEIEKCEVRCANCHRRRTAENRGWYKMVNRSVV